MPTNGQPNDRLQLLNGRRDLVEHPEEPASNQRADEETWVNKLRATQCEVFLDQRCQPFIAAASLVPAPHVAVWPLKSRKARRLLSSRLRSLLKREPTPSELKKFIGMLDDLAGDVERELNNRVAHEHQQRIVIDLADAEWRQIVLDVKGWQVTHHTVPVFRRFNHQEPLPLPRNDGDVMRLFEFLPISVPETQLLVLAWLAACFVPWLSKVILLVLGQQGSAKTTFCRLVRQLVDPSRTLGLGEVHERDVVQVLQHHAVPVFDNVSHFTARISDTLCRAVTGEAIERRQLYTDAESFFFAYRRPIIVNGVGLPTHRADFLDRCIPLHLRRLDAFASQVDLEAGFKAAVPGILGGLLNLLVVTLRLLPETPLPTNFRQADFARFGRAFARALGKEPESFDEAYAAHTSEAAYLTLDDQPLVECLQKLASSQVQERPWKGNATALLKALHEVAKQEDIDHRGADWPKEPRRLAAMLDSLEPALKLQGVVVTRRQRAGTIRAWEVYPV